MKFAFEIIQTVSGQPDPGSYPSGLAHAPEMDTCAMVVVEEFDTEDEARSQNCTHEEGYKSQVWQKHCPQMFKFEDCKGGLDVYYIDPVSDKEAEKIHQRNKKALGDEYSH